MGFLIDTCVWVDVERGALAPADVAALSRGEPIFISPVTLAELRFGAEIAPDASTRQKRLAALRRLERKPLLTIDGATGGIFGSLAAQIRAAGRQHRYRVQDLWLAARPCNIPSGCLPGMLTTSKTFRGSTSCCTIWPALELKGSSRHFTRSEAG